MKKKLFVITLLLIPSIFIGCLKTEALDASKIIDIRYLAENVSTNITNDIDTVRVDEVKFFVNSFKINTDDNRSIASVNPLIFSYDDANAGFSNTIRISELGFITLNNFTTAQYLFSPISSSVNDDDLVFQDQDYTAFLSGTFNGEAFVIRSQLVDSTSFTFDPVSISNFNETLRVELRSDMSNVFSSGDGLILSPFDENSVIQIFENLINQFEIRVRETTIFMGLR